MTTPRSPIQTRRANAKTLRVFEDPPASPSTSAAHFSSVSTAIATVPTTTAPTATMPSTNVPAATTSSARETMLPRTATGIAGNRSRAASIRSQRSTSSAVLRIRQAELDAEERLAELRREERMAELQTQAALIKKRLALDVAIIHDETDRESACAEEIVETTETAEAHDKVQDWLRYSAIRGESGERVRVAQEYRSPLRKETVEPPPHTRRDDHTTPRRPRSPTPARSKDRAIEKLADTLDRLGRGRRPSRQTQDIPVFSGAIGEWLPFKAAMTESTTLHGFTTAENLARLRNCLRGEARKAVSALLHTATEPTIIMATLEQCYGRPEMIIDQAFEELKRLPRLGSSADELNGFAIKLQNIVAVVNCVDKKGYLQNPMLARHVVDKLSPHIKSRWCDYAEEHGSLTEPEILTLSKFLMREADRAIRHTYASKCAVGPARNETKREPPYRSKEQIRKAPVYTTTERPKLGACCCCGADHEIMKCSQLKAMTVPDRWTWAKEARVCFRCLSSKHRAFLCKAKKCGVDECRQLHHKLLHSNKETNKPAHTDQTALTASAHASSIDHQVFLKVCPVVIKAHDGQDVATYALFDEGSTISLIDDETARMLGATGPTRSLNIHGATSSQREPDSRVIDLQLRGKGRTDFHTVRVRTVKSMSLGSQTISADILQLPHLRTLKAENVCYEYGRPRILIGADNWDLIITRKLLMGKRNQPAASLTQLGWVISGLVPRNVITQNEEAVLHARTAQETQRNSLTDDRDNELHEIVKAHYDIDALGISAKRKPIAENERAIEIFNNTANRVNGHYEVGLPWKNDDIALPPSYNMALSRLRGIERKMDRSPQFKEAYTAQVDNLLEKGYADRCRQAHVGDKHTWFLPHFAVSNPNKPGKLRMVFDAAARTSNVCLNDALLDGPDLLQSLYGVLFRFRKKPIAITADIREMFLQVRIRVQDRVAQHFLWRGDNRTKPPDTYEMTSMIFGARSSPFMAHSVRNDNATEYKESHPMAYHAITENHYMDDWLDSFDDEETAAQVMAQVQDVHKRAGFELASWGSNRQGLLQLIPDADKACAPKELGANAHEYGKTLGILWMQSTDELAFNTTLPRVPDGVKQRWQTPTKREALGTVMSIFDPLGLLSPYTITAKVMLQELWKKKIDWDDPLPDEEAAVFNEWFEDLRYISDLRLPRCYGGRDKVDEQLHVFCDASEQAYAAVAYWRYVYADGSVSVAMVAGKAKVAPMKTQSIPRMELQASLIGTRLATEILRQHQVDTKVVLWSDSKTVLHWIKNDSAKYTPYVSHRLSEIAELTTVDQWRWVPTAHNVADDATRAGNTRLRSSDRWFTGPPFLREPEEQWPQETTTDSMQDSEFEVITHVTTRTAFIDIQRFSSYQRLLRTVAIVLAFRDKCRRRATQVNVEHIREAERVIIREAQMDSFYDEMQKLQKDKHVDRASRLHRLDPKLSEEGVILLNGRINAATVPEGMKEPPILDGAHPLTRLIIEHEHTSQNHVGREQIVNNLRQRYWILRLRPIVKTILRQCVRCKIRRASPSIPVKGNLPQVRLEAYTRPFSHCGIDCFGPMWVTIGRRREKRWGMLFTCLVTRAIHVELIAGLSTDSAIMALRRMAARRGWPQKFLSDNGTNFHGAEVELQKAYVEWLPEMQNYTLAKQIDWRYIDPGAPNQGGAWERLIKSVKSALYTVLNERAPKEEVLATLMAEVEHTVNSRPLTHVSVETDDAEALTPNHFLLGTATGLPYVGECDVANRQTWRAAQALANMFWARWVKEYLPTLTPRGDVRKVTENPKTGDIVIIADGSLPRNTWPRGLIEKVYIGPDKVARSADVRTRGGIFRRPIRRLIVLPISKGCESLRRGETVTDGEVS